MISSCIENSIHVQHHNVCFLEKGNPERLGPPKRYTNLQYFRSMLLVTFIPTNTNTREYPMRPGNGIESRGTAVSFGLFNFKTRKNPSLVSPTLLLLPSFQNCRCAMMPAGIAVFQNQPEDGKLQPWPLAFRRLLNNPYVNEVYLTRQNPHLKCCQHLKT